MTVGGHIHGDGNPGGATATGDGSPASQAQLSAVEGATARPNGDLIRTVGRLGSHRPGIVPQPGRHHDVDSERPPGPERTARDPDDTSSDPA